MDKSEVGSEHGAVVDEDSKANTESGFDKWMSSIKPLEEVQLSPQKLLPSITPDSQSEKSLPLSNDDIQLDADGSIIGDSGINDKSIAESNNSRKSDVSTRDQHFDPVIAKVDVPMQESSPSDQSAVDEKKKQEIGDENGDKISQYSALSLIKPQIQDELFVGVTHNNNSWKKAALVLALLLFIAVIIIIVLIIVMVYVVISKEDCHCQAATQSTTVPDTSSVHMNITSDMTTSSYFSSTPEPCQSYDIAQFCTIKQYNSVRTAGCCCHNNPDVVIVIDTSASMSTLVTEIKQFLTNLIQSFTLDNTANSLRFALVNTKPGIEWRLDSLFSQSNSLFLTGVNAVDFTGGDSSFTGAYEKVNNEVLGVTGDRADSPNVIITIGDGDIVTFGLDGQIQALNNQTRLLIGVYTGSTALNMNLVATNNSSLFSIQQVNSVIDILKKL